MKTKLIMSSLAIALLLGMAGCKNVTSSRAPSTAVTGEAWYVKETWFLLTWKTQVFYCPAPKSPGPATCIEAIVHEEGEMPAGGFGMGQPMGQPQPQPAAPGYGQPAQPAPGGYGQPMQPDPDGFGQPAQPAPPAQPGAPGYQPQPPPPPPPSY